MTSAVGILAGHNYQADFISKICQFFFYLHNFFFFKSLYILTLKTFFFLLYLTTFWKKKKTCTLNYKVYVNVSCD